MAKYTKHLVTAWAVTAAVSAFWLPRLSIAGGAQLYQVHCAACHGARGKGDGEAALWLLPRPRDLTQGVFRLRSNSANPSPDLTDLMSTIARGMPGTGMPGFPHLSERELRSLARFVSSLARRAQPSAAGGSHRLEFATLPAPTPQVLEQGQAAYARLQCATCHGPSGAGDGPAAAFLKDDRGLPVAPRDFTREPFKGGHDAQSIALRIRTGLEGASMPAYGTEQASAEELWSLAHFVKSLCRAEGCNDDSAPVLLPLSCEKPLSQEALPAALDPAWARVPATRIALHPTWNGGRTQVRHLSVQLLSDDRLLVLRLQWSDPTRDVTTVRPEDFRDAVAVQYSPRPAPTPLAMGSAKAPVSLWQWRADWQDAIDRRRIAGPLDAHPYMPADANPFPVVAAALVGNPSAVRERATPVQELTARGVDQLLPAAAESPALRGSGVWRDGVWTVVLARSLDADEAAQSVRRSRQMAFAVWDGAHSERAGQKVVSRWYTLGGCDRQGWQTRR